MEVLERASQSQKGFEDYVYNYEKQYQKYCRTRHERGDIPEGVQISKFTYGFACVSIADLLEFNERLAKAAKELISTICTHFASRNNVHDTEKIRAVVKTILSAYDTRFSIFGLIHCLDCLEQRTAPFIDFDKQYGWAVADISRAFRIYVQHAEREYHNFEDALKDKHSAQANFAGMIKHAPESILDAYRNLEQKYNEQRQANKLNPGKTYEEKRTQAQLLRDIEEAQERLAQRLAAEDPSWQPF